MNGTRRSILAVGAALAVPAISDANQDLVPAVRVTRDYVDGPYGQIDVRIARPARAFLDEK